MTGILNYPTILRNSLRDPKQLIIIYHISTVESVIDDGNNENIEMDDDDEGNLKKIVQDIIFNT